MTLNQGVYAVHHHWLSQHQSAVHGWVERHRACHGGFPAQPLCGQQEHCGQLPQGPGWPSYTLDDPSLVSALHTFAVAAMSVLSMVHDQRLEIHSSPGSYSSALETWGIAAAGESGMMSVESEPSCCCRLLLRFSPLNTTVSVACLG